MDFEKLLEEQRDLARKLVLDRKLENFRFVCGVDVSYNEKVACCCAVLWDCSSKQVVDKSFVEIRADLMFPYVPGLLCYREGDIMAEAVSRLDRAIDVVLVDGNGILHPRKLGLASYVGLKLELPTVGVAKRLLCGEIRDGRIFVQGREVGRVLKAVTGSPLYISPGHLIDIESSAKVVSSCLLDHRLPQPVWMAHRLSRMKVKGGSNL